jgi:hypothetical protein
MREMVRQDKLKQEKERLARMQLKQVHQFQQKEHTQESVTAPTPHLPSRSLLTDLWLPPSVRSQDASPEQRGVCEPGAALLFRAVWYQPPIAHCCTAHGRSLSALYISPSAVR